MALEIRDRIKETCTGTNGDMALTGAVAGFVGFDLDVTLDGDTIYYCLVDADGTKWEVGLGTLSADSTSIARTTILSTQTSFTDTTRQTFSGGTHTIFATYPASKSVYLDASGVLSHSIVDADISGSASIANSKLANSSVSFGGIGVALGASDATPAFDLSDATNYPTSSLSGTITNAQLAGSIANAKLANDSVSFGGITVALGASDATPAFDLSDATSYPTSSLSGTITNAQLAGSIANAKLVNDGITIAGADTSLGGTITADTIAGQISVNTIAFTQIADLARGSILYGNASANTAELTKGSANTVLQSDGTDVSWGTVTNAMLAGSIANAKLANDSVSYGGISLDLGGTDATPAFDLSDATNYPTSSLSGTITNAQLAGSIANAKLANDSVSFGGITVALGASDATPAFDLADATNYPTSSLSGTVTNAQLAGSIANAKLANDSVSFGGITVALGASDATPAFDLSDATSYPTSSLSGTITNAQLAGSIANAKLANSAITVAVGSDSTAISLGATMTFAGTANEVEVAESSGTVTIGLPSSITVNVTGNVTGNTSGSSGSCTGNSATATLASTVTVTDSTADTAFPVVFHDESNALLDDTATFTYNPNSGTVVATAFSGPLTGNVTGNASGSSGSCTGNAATVTNGVYTTNNLSVMAATTSVQLAGVISDETGSGALVFANSPTLVTPALGTPSALVATNASGTAASLTVGLVTVTDSTADTAFPVTFHDESNALLDDTGAFTYNPNSSTVTATTFVGALTGNASGSSGSCTGNAATATEATSITVTANNTTNETVYPLFVDGATGTQGAETDTGLTYNPSSGLLTAAGFSGPLTGNVTGNASGTALTVTQAAQSAITSVGTLTSVVVADGGNIGSASDTDAISIASTGAVTFSKATKPALNDLTEADSVEINVNLANLHTLTLNRATTTLTVENETVGQRFIIRVTQDGTGSRALNFFSGISWAGSAPTITATGSKTDVFGFLCTATDTYDGFVIGQNI